MHLPSDGHPLQGYDEARADILAHGGTVAGVASGDDPTAAAYAGSSGPHKSLWATLFGGGADEDEDRADAAASGRVTPRGRAAREPTQVASLAPVSTNGDDNGAHALVMAQAVQEQTAATPQASQADARLTRRSQNLDRSRHHASGHDAADRSSPSGGHLRGQDRRGNPRRRKA